MQQRPQAQRDEEGDGDSRLGRAPGADMPRTERQQPRADQRAFDGHQSLQGQKDKEQCGDAEEGCAQAQAQDRVVGEQKGRLRGRREGVEPQPLAGLTQLQRIHALAADTGSGH